MQEATVSPTQVEQVIQLSMEHTLQGESDAHSQDNPAEHTQGEPSFFLQENTTGQIQGETSNSLQDECIPLQGEHTSMQGNISTQSHNDDNKSHTENVLPVEHIQETLKPRSRNPPIRYGEWIKYDDSRSNTGSAAFIATKSERIPEPKTYQEAMKSAHAQQWQEAMAKEFASLMTNKTWVLKPLPEGRKAVKCKWILKVKYKPSGEVERFKARLVAKGFSQVAGVDFNETYTPVIKYDVVRTV